MSLAIGGAINVAFLAAVFVSNLPEGVAGTVNLDRLPAVHAAPSSGCGRSWCSSQLPAPGWAILIIQLLPAADGRIAQAFAAGAMLTMLADAMMPEAFEHGGKLVGIFTVMGFLAGCRVGSHCVQ